jgi:hypothetical protein
MLIRLSEDIPGLRVLDVQEILRDPERALRDVLRDGQEITFRNCFHPDLLKEKLEAKECADHRPSLGRLQAS